MYNLTVVRNACVRSFCLELTICAGMSDKVCKRVDGRDNAVGRAVCCLNVPFVVAHLVISGVPSRR